jgi:ribosomal protein S5
VYFLYLVTHAVSVSLSPGPAGRAMVASDQPDLSRSADRLIFRIAGLGVVSANEPGSHNPDKNAPALATRCSQKSFVTIQVEK